MESIPDYQVDFTESKSFESSCLLYKYDINATRWTHILRGSLYIYVLKKVPFFRIICLNHNSLDDFNQEIDISKLVIFFDKMTICLLDKDIYGFLLVWKRENKHLFEYLESSIRSERMAIADLSIYTQTPKQKDPNTSFLNFVQKMSIPQNIEKIEKTTECLTQEKPIQTQLVDAISQVDERDENSKKMTKKQLKDFIVTLIDDENIMELIYSIYSKSFKS